MPLPRRWTLAAAVLLLGACDGSSGANGIGPTVREETTTTTTTAPADPYAVPEAIDAAYVDRVLAALYKVDGDAARIIVREGEIVPEAANTLRAVYADDELNDQLRLWGEAIMERFEGIRDPPGDVVVRVEGVRSARPDCIFVAVKADFSATAVTPSEPRTSYRTLTTKPAGIDPAGLNPTPWVIALDVVTVDGAPPADPC